MAKSNLRISFGSGRCRGVVSDDPAIKQICLMVLMKLESLKQLPVETLRGLPSTSEEKKIVAKKTLIIRTYNTSIEGGAALVIVQAFLPTLFCPTYFSTSGVGKIFAEALLITPAGDVKDAQDELLWEYR